MIETKYRITRSTVSRRTDGYLCITTEHRQLLHKQTVLFGQVIWDEVIDREIIPQHVVIEIGALGSTDWRSKWVETHPECFERASRS